jgi:hypothetical protein
MLYVKQRVRVMDGTPDRRVPRLGLSSAGRAGGLRSGARESAAHLEVANWLLSQQLNTASDPARVTEAAECVLRKLLRRLAMLITPIGCQALLSRALHLARADFPFLGRLEAGMTDDAWLLGIHPGLDGLETGLLRHVQAAKLKVRGLVAALARRRG